MAWTYSGNPKNSLRDACRFLVGDTSADSAIFQDEELDYLIELYGDSEALRYHLFSQAATIYARDCVKRTLGPQSEDPKTRLEYFKSQAEFYRRRLSSAGISLPFSFRRPKIFNIGMQNNPPRRGRHVRKH